MKIPLMSSVSDGRPIEYREYFAEASDVIWDERTVLQSDLTLVIETARKHAELEAGNPMHLGQLSLQLVGPVEGVRYYYFVAYFQHAKGERDPIHLVLDLRGTVIRPELKLFDDEDAYARYAYRDKR